MPKCVSGLASLLPAVLPALLLASCAGQPAGQDPGTGGAASPSSDGGAAGDGGPPSPPPSPDPGQPGCGLPAAAFCDTLATPSPGGRGGDVDDAKWSVTRVTNLVNPGQGNW